MSNRLPQQIRQNFEKKSNLELQRVVAERDSGEWSDDAIKVAEELFAERPDEPFDDAPIKENDFIDTRGQGAFKLTALEIAAYRTKIQVLGWVFCILGVLAAAICIMPMVFGASGRFPLRVIGLGISGLIIGVLIVLIGVDLIRLNPRARINGLVISVFLLLFFPIGTIIGICGVLWLGKRGSVLGSIPNQESNLTEQVKPH